MDVLQALSNRRSIGRMKPESPTREQVEAVLGAAVHAPNHHNTQPWRFFVFANEGRDVLAGAWAAAFEEDLRQRGAPPEKIDGMVAAERAKPMRSPVVVVVGAVQDMGDPQKAREDFQATGAAIQNMLLAADALGLAAVWRTGFFAYSDRAKAFLGLQAADEIAGMIYLGYPDETFAASLPQRDRSHDAITEWHGNLP